MNNHKDVQAVYTFVIEDAITKLTPEFENAGLPLTILAHLQKMWMELMIANLNLPAADPVALPPPATMITVPMIHTQSIGESKTTGIAEGVGKNGENGNGISGRSNHAQTEATTTQTDEQAPLPDENDLRYTLASGDLMQVKKEDPMQTEESTSNGQSVDHHPLGSGPTIKTEPTIDTNTATIEDEGATMGVAPNVEAESESSELSDSDSEPDYSDWRNHLFCFYDSLKRTKNRRKYTISKGILQLGGKDILFKSGTAEFDWK